MEKENKLTDGALDPIHGMRTEMIMRARVRGFDDAAIEPILLHRIWRAFGYERLGDYLELELGLPMKRVIRWVNRAIAEGVEPASLYPVLPDVA